MDSLFLLLGKPKNITYQNLISSMDFDKYTYLKTPGVDQLAFCNFSKKSYNCNSMVQHATCNLSWCRMIHYKPYQQAQSGQTTTMVNNINCSHSSFGLGMQYSLFFLLLTKTCRIYCLAFILTCTGISVHQHF